MHTIYLLAAEQGRRLQEAEYQSPQWRHRASYRLVRQPRGSAARVRALFSRNSWRIRPARAQRWFGMSAETR